MRPTRHVEIEELLGAFALDALDPDEADAVELHLRDCPRCRAEVAEHRETAALLAYSGAEAPAGVWERIVAGLEEPPPKLELARVVPMRSSRLRTIGIQALTAAAVVISLLALGVALGERDGGPADGSLDAAIASAAVHPDAKHVHLVAGDKSRKAEIVLIKGQGYLAEHSLPKLAPGQTYQLWGMRGETRVSLGVLGAAPARGQFPATADYQSLAITVEARGGAPQPTGPAVASGWVPA